MNHEFLQGRLGGLRDLPDPRDRMHEAKAGRAPAPASVDLRGQCPPIYDQGQINSCTAQAIAAAIQYARMKHAQMPDFIPSRLFIYYYERAVQGQTATDSGARTRDGIKVVKQMGAPPESLWPYDSAPASPPGGSFPPDARAATEPPAQVVKAAKPFEVLNYQRLRNNLEAMKACLAEGYPFTMGIVVYPSFMASPGKQNVVIPMPGTDEQPLGEHIVLAVGYDDAKQWVICRNSWGVSQGDGGYFYLPYAYAGSRPRIGDLWTLRTVAD